MKRGDLSEGPESMLLGVALAPSEFGRRLGSDEIERATAVECDSMGASEYLFAAQ